MKKYKARVLSFIIIVVIMLHSGMVVYASDDNASTPSGIPVSELENVIENYMKDYIGNEANGAAVIYIQDGKIAFSKGYGYADVENEIEVDPEKTVFEYASISKTFTWTAMMQLVEQGKIDLNQDIMEYFPDDFRKELESNLKYDKPIRVIDLMNHRAGFEDKYFFTDCTSEEELWDNLKESLIKAMPEQIYEPDSITAYSNYSTDLGGYIVECVTNKKLYDYIQENIFDVTGMDMASANPRYDEIDFIMDNKANGYGENVTGKGWTYLNLYPDGSINGTALDLAKFAMAFMEEECPLFVNQKTVEELFTTSYTVSENMSGCAHGFWEYNGAEKFYQHDGGHNGFTSIYGFSPTSKTGLVVLTNTGDEPYIPYGLLQLVLGDNSELNVKACENGPDANEIDGMEFLTARQNYSDITSLAGYLDGNMKIEVIDESTIECNGLKYIQTAPYFYELADHGDNLIARGIYSEMYFYGEDGEITGVNMGGMQASDSKRSHFPYSNLGLIMQLILLSLSAATFVIMPFIILVKYVINKKNKTIQSRNEKNYNRFINGITACGTLTVVNEVVLIGILLSMSEFESATGINIQIGLNYVLVVFFVILMILRIIKVTRNEEKIFHKKRHIIIAIQFVIITILLIMWNFFSFIL